MRRLSAGLVVLALAAVPQVPANAATRSVCTGVKGCKVVASADIDGDGRSDQVGVASRGITKAGGGTIKVRVKTAKGKVLQTTGSQALWGYQPFHGVASIDGERGKEIVVGDSVGAHTLQWRIVTYRNGKLVSLKPPPGTWILRPSRWTTDGSATTHIGWSRKVSSKGKISLVHKTAVGDPGRGGTGRTTTYLWKSGRWVKTSSVKKKYSSFKAATAIEGWHIKGLRVWPK
jgi:hypothetical protein